MDFWEEVYSDIVSGSRREKCETICYATNKQGEANEAQDTDQNVGDAE